MPRALKVFKTHIGFYDLIVAAPSMKAAVEAWEAHPRIFAQGFAAVTNEPDAVKAALAHPGVVLRRVHGQAGEYKAKADKPAVPKLTARQKQKAAHAEKRHAAERNKAEKIAARKKVIARELHANSRRAKKPRRKSAPRQRRKASWRISSGRKPGCGNAGMPCRSNFTCAVFRATCS